MEDDLIRMIPLQKRISLYIGILKVFKEIQEVGMIYGDVSDKNFMFNLRPTKSNA